MILNSTKYKNPQRTIVGVINSVFNGDTIILCDTSLGIVNLNLLEIPNDQWNTTYKLYVADRSNNAAINNITIFAPLGFTINGASSLVISTNGATALIRVTSNTGYIASLSSGGSGGSSLAILNQSFPLIPSASSLNFIGIQADNFGSAVTINNSFIIVGYLDLVALVASNSLITSQQYRLLNAIFGTSGFYHEVYLSATSSNSISILGTGRFFNADYNFIGNYSGVTGYVSNLGVWAQTLVVVVGNVCIWDNLQYVNLTGVNDPLTSPNFDLTNWQLLNYDVNNGYIINYDEINYDITTNRIKYRKDILNNQVYDYINPDSPTICALNIFMWGNINVYNNVLCQTSLFSICNTLQLRKVIKDNTLKNSEVFLSDPINILNPIVLNQMIGNIFESCLPISIYCNRNTAVLNYNQFFLTNGVITNNQDFVLNRFTESVVNIINENDFKRNTFDFCTTRIDINNLASGTFLENYFFAMYLINIINDGNISKNYFSSSSIEIIANISLISENTASNLSSMRITDNQGIISYNNLDTSTLTILLNTSTGKVVYSKLINKSLLEITIQNNGLIGTSIKGDGNVLINSTISIGTFIDSTKVIYSNELYNSRISMGTMEHNLFDNVLKETEIDFESSIYPFSGLNLTNALYGSPTYIVGQSVTSGVYMKGLGSINVILDCSDPLIYDLPTQTLIIPVEFRSIIGIITLKNASGIFIREIAGLTNFLETTFLNDLGTTNFVTTAIGVAINGEIISNQPAPYTFKIVYRAVGQDYIKMQRRGLSEVTEAGIFV